MDTLDNIVTWINALSTPILLLVLIILIIWKEVLSKSKKSTLKKSNPLEKSPIKFMSKVVLFCISFIVAYTITQIVLNYSLGIELSPTLTTCVYTFFGTELAVCALIRIFDIFDKRDSKTQVPESIEENNNEI